jgi:hypothetical protein
MVFYKLESICTPALVVFSVCPGVCRNSRRSSPRIWWPTKSPLIRICICGLFCDFVSIRIMWLRMVGCLMNWKGFGRKRPWPSRGSFPAFAWRNWRKPRRTSVRIAGILSEIRAEDLRNIYSELPLHQHDCYWECVTIVSLDANNYCSLNTSLNDVRVDQLSTHTFPKSKN